MIELGKDLFAQSKKKFCGWIIDQKKSIIRQINWAIKSTNDPETRIARVNMYIESIYKILLYKQYIYKQYIYKKCIYKEYS